MSSDSLDWVHTPKFHPSRGRCLVVGAGHYSALGGAKKGEGNELRAFGLRED